MSSTTDSTSVPWKGGRVALPGSVAYFIGCDADTNSYFSQGRGKCREFLVLVGWILLLLWANAQTVFATVKVAFSCLHTPFAGSV